MRTTISLDDEAAEIAAEYARGRALTLSKAISELIVNAARRRLRVKYVDGIPVLDLGASEEPISAEQVKALETEAE